MIHAFDKELKSLGIHHNQQLFLAISGGIDSMVLSHLLLELSIPHTLLHCNFKLRGEASDLDEAFVIEHAKKNQLSVFTTQFETKKLAQKMGLNTQLCARELRYQWFNGFLKNESDILLTAHHLDDNIETFFINMLRGTGLKGLTAIKAKQHPIYRPLLPFSQQDIVDYATQNSIEFREDESNASDDYLRNKIRHHLIPLYKSLGEQTEKKFSQLNQELNDIDSYLELQVKQLKEKLNDSSALSIEILLGLPPFLLVKLFDKQGIYRKNVSEFIHFLKSDTGALFETEDVTFLNNRGEILVKEKQLINVDDSFQLDQNPQTLKCHQSYFHLSEVELSQVKFSPNTAYFDADKLSYPLEIRKWKKGDKMIPLGLSGSKLVSDILNDLKINRFEKENQWIVADQKQIIWVVGLRVSQQTAISKQTKAVIKLDYTQ